MKLRRLKSKALILFYALLFILVFRLSAPAQETVDPKIIEGAKKEGQVVWYTIMTLEPNRSPTGFRKSIRSSSPCSFAREAVRCIGGKALMTKDAKRDAIKSEPGLGSFL